MSDIATNKCLICGNEFSHKKKEWSRRQLVSHVIRIHTMSFESYIIKYYHNDAIPLCQCGCGNFVEFRKSIFLRYYKDHKNRTMASDETKEKITVGLLKRYDENYINLGFSIEKLNDYYNLYKLPEYNADKIAELSGSDFRTISRWWIKLNIVSKSALEKLAKKHQSIYSHVGENRSFTKIPEDKLNQISKYIEILSKNDHEISLETIVDLFHLECSSWILGKRLVETFGEDILKFKKGLASKPEIKYINMIRFFVGNKEVTTQFPLCGKKYDAKIGERLLIEFDGDFWHSEKNTFYTKDDLSKVQNKDKEKDDIAKNLGYTLIRVKESESKNPEILMNIIKTFKELEAKNEIQIS